MTGSSSSTGYLLDTCTALLALADPDALSPTARRAILAGPNVLSVVSYWEVVLKSMKGTLEVGDPRVWWLDALEQLGATPLVLSPQHIAGVYGLPALHKDPFDRILIAQATAERLALVSIDVDIARYATKTLRVVGWETKASPPLHPSSECEAQSSFTISATRPAMRSPGN